jgi:hypothetical protein
MKGLVKRFNSFHVLDYASAFVKPTGREMRPEESKEFEVFKELPEFKNIGYRRQDLKKSPHTSVKTAHLRWVKTAMLFLSSPDIWHLGRHHRHKLNIGLKREVCHIENSVGHN